MLESIYGENFVDGPDYLKDLMICNNKKVNNPHYLTSDLESTEFENKNFNLVIESVDIKVDFLKRATKKLIKKDLIVNSKNNYAIFIEIVNHPIITAIGWLATVSSFVLAIYLWVK
jgi:hypothetical protein